MSESENTWKGCHGEQLSYDELDQFVEDCFVLDDVNEKTGSERFATNIIGHTGIGKTSKIKQFANTPVEWRGNKYDGYDVRSVPIAQFEEMGDLHGMPDKHILVKRTLNQAPGSSSVTNQIEERWVPIEMVKGYTSLGWGIDTSSGVRTMYAPPEWVPTTVGPCILNLDDWNRANGRIIKGCMQFLQEYGLMSWKLPPGCHITMTMNPDEQDYFVTTIDRAVLQRLRSATLKFNAKEWAVWATRAKIDPRVVSYVLAYPEMITTGERNSPRSISEFGRFLTAIPNASIRRMQVMAASVLDAELVTSLLTFMDRDFEMVVTPEDILNGSKSVTAHLQDLMSRKEKRIDVIGVTVDRLFAHLAQPDVIPEAKTVKNVQAFIKSEYLAAEMRYVFVDRLNKASEKDSKMDKWFMGDKELMQTIMELV